MNKLCLLLCALFLCLSLPCLAAPDTRDVSGLRADIAMQDYAKTLKDGTPAQIAAWYAPDGQLLLPGTAPLTGPKAIEAFLLPLVKMAKVTAVFVHTDRVIEAKPCAVLFGTYVETYTLPDGKAQAAAGRYASEWRQERHGDWKIVRLIMQPGPTPELSDPVHP